MEIKTISKPPNTLQLFTTHTNPEKSNIINLFFEIKLLPNAHFIQPILFYEKLNGCQIDRFLLTTDKFDINFLMLISVWGANSSSD